MKMTINPMEELLWFNDPKTYGIVYKGTKEIVIHGGREQYFRSRDVALQFMERLEKIFIDSELEVIQFQPTGKDKLNKAKKKEISRTIAKKQKKSSERLKNRRRTTSRFISDLFSSQKILNKSRKEELSK